MRRQSQLADLIAGSGLVSGVGRRASSQDGNNVQPAQPVLYHFGATRVGSVGSTSSKEHRDRAPLPSGPNSSISGAAPAAPASSGGGRPPPGVAWSTPNGTPNTATSNLSTELAGNGSFGGAGAQSWRSIDAPTELMAATVSAPPQLPLPQLGGLRPGAGADAHDTPSTSVGMGPGFLPAVSVTASDLGQPPHDPHHYQQQQHPQPSSMASQASGSGSGVGTPAVSSSGAGAGGWMGGGAQSDPRVNGGGSATAGGAGGGGSQGQGSGPASHQQQQQQQQQQVSQPHWTYYGGTGSTTISYSATPAPDCGGDSGDGGDGDDKPSGATSGGAAAGGGGSMGIGSDLASAAGAWQYVTAYPQSAGGAEGGGTSAGGGGGNAAGSSGGRSLTSGGGGGGTGNSRNAHSGGRVRAFGGAGGGFTNKQRWGRPNSRGGAGGHSGIHRSSSESSARTSSDAAGVALAMSVQGAWSVAAADGGSGGASQGGGGGGSVRSSRAGPLTPGATAELVVVEEEDSGIFAAPTSGAGAAAVARGGSGDRAGAGGARSHAGSSPHIGGGGGNGSLSSPYAGPSGAATAAAAAACGVASAGAAAGFGTPAALSAVVPSAGGPSGVVALPHPGSPGAISELVELRRVVAELNGQVARLTTQLRDSELAAAQLQSMAAAAVASEREAAEMEVARRHMKGLKAAEAARDKAEIARRSAEKRAKAAEEELAVTREKLEAKAKQVVDLEAAVSAAQASLDKQRKAHEEALETLEGQHKAQSRKQQQDMHEQKVAQQESMSKLQGDIAKRNQTVLALQADLEAAQAAGAAKDRQLEELREAVASLEADLDRERERFRWMAEARAETDSERQQEAGTEEALPISPRGRSKASAAESTPETAFAAAGGAAAAATAAAAPSISITPMQSTAAATSGGGGRPPTGDRHRGASPSLRRGLSAAGSVGSLAGGGGGGPLMDEQSRAIRKMQSEVAAIREDYARRLVDMDDVVATCEASMRDGMQGLERMFNVLVSRTAGILAGRLGSFKGLLPGAKGAGRPGTPVGAGGGGGAPVVVRGATAAAAAAAAAGASNAVLHMNERLAAENAQLLAELSRWQSGRHAMLRKLNMVVLGTEPPPPTAAPLTHQQKIAQALAAVTSGGSAAAAVAAAAAAAAPPPPPPPPPRANNNLFQYQQNFTGAPPPPSGGGAGADAALTAAREALAVATRDALLAGRKELLPAVMTAEGWGGAASHGGWDPATAAQQLHGGKVEGALAGAESSLRLRTQLLALQAEVTRSRAAGGEVLERGREREREEEDYEAALLELRRELNAAKHQMSHMQRELERARAGINTGPDAGRSGAQDAVERERLEEALTAARDETSRHKQVAAAAKRDLEARERALEEAQLRCERLEAQCREARSEAQRHGEGVKRLRLLLAQAKSLLKEQGVPFMEDDPGLEVLLAAEKDKDRGGGGRGARLSGKLSNCPPDPDAPLFKALDAREREKELQRLQSEAADLAAQLAAATKEVKRVKKAAAAQADAAAQAEREQRLALAGAIDGLARDAEAARDATRAVQRQLQESQHEAGELRRQVAELTDKLTRAKLDADYLKSRAAAGKMKPKLSHARALSISISATATAAASAAVAPEG